MTLRHRRPGLLVSVRDVAEVHEAIVGGADIIDVKEPTRGSLGRPIGSVLDTVVERVAKRRLISVALGELAEWEPLANGFLDGISLVKIGLAGRPAESAWRMELARLRMQLEESWPARVVAVAYADWHRANAPPPYDVMEEAISNRYAALLIDTWGKDGKTLLDWLGVQETIDLCRACREAVLPVALAGSLGLEQIRELAPARPDLFAVRGAACVGGNRNATVSREQVAALVEQISLNR